MALTTKGRWIGTVVTTARATETGTVVTTTVATESGTVVAIAGVTGAEADRQRQPSEICRQALRRS